MQNRSEPDKTAFITGLARDYLGLPDTNRFADAVAGLEDALARYPLCNELIYFGPLNFAPALPLDAAPLTGQALTVSCLNKARGDAWERSLGPFTVEEVIAALEDMAKSMQSALTLFEQTLFPTHSPFDTSLAGYQGPPVIPRHADRVSDEELAENLRSTLPEDVFRALPELAGVTGLHRLAEWCNAHYLLACVESAARVYKNFKAKRDQAPDYAGQLKTMQAEELRTLKRLLPLLHLDARLGLHLECQEYFITAPILNRKIERDLRRSVST